MHNRINEIVLKIEELKEQLEIEFAAKRENFHYRVERSRIFFEEEMAHRHRAVRVHYWPYIKNTHPLIILTSPVIYAVIVPLLLLDLFISIYQWICFPVYGICTVNRREYIIFDRRHLKYLNGIEKLNCTYCSYASGLIAFVHEVISRTEQYWCPIKHARKVAGIHTRYPEFTEFGDASQYRDQLEIFRHKLRSEKNPR